MGEEAQESEELPLSAEILPPPKEPSDLPVEESAPPRKEAENPSQPQKQPRSSQEEIAAGIQDIRKEISSAEEKKKDRLPDAAVLAAEKSQRPSGRGFQRTAAGNRSETAADPPYFGVDVTVTNVSCGPTVTRYEIQPEQGVKVSRIVGLSDDIKLNLAAADIRIEAPIPGRPLWGSRFPIRPTVL